MSFSEINLCAVTHQVVFNSQSVNKSVGVSLEVSRIMYVLLDENQTQ